MAVPKGEEMFEELWFETLSVVVGFDCSDNYGSKPNLEIIIIIVVGHDL